MITAFTAYKDTAGKLYLSVEAVQAAERRALYHQVLKAGTSANPQLARLDPELTVDLLMALGKSIGEIANDRLTPQGTREAPIISVMGAAAEAPAALGSVLAAARKVGKAPELAMPYGGKQPDMRERGFTASLEKLTPETPIKNQEPIQNQAAEKTAGSEKVWPRHPLDPAVSRAEGMEPKLDEAELDQMIEQGMRQAGGVSGRGN